MGRDSISGDSEGFDGPGDDETLHRTIEPDADVADMELVELVADLNDVDQDELPPLYNCIDGMVERLFGDPPPTDATVELAFRYAGYWIKLDQAGNVVLQRQTDD